MTLDKFKKTPDIKITSIAIFSHSNNRLETLCRRIPWTPARKSGSKICLKVKIRSMQSGSGGKLVWFSRVLLSHALNNLCRMSPTSNLNVILSKLISVSFRLTISHLSYKSV